MIQANRIGAAMLLGIWCLVCSPAGGLAGDAPDFGSHWHDGRAELCGYRWTGTRYGEERSGRCVMIFVTEPFSRSQLVKVDDPAQQPSGDVFEVLKLNLVREFQTGIYDYHTMTSVFVGSDDFTPVKTSFSSGEWCGHVFEEMRFDTRRILRQYFSYFQDESTSNTIERRADGLVGDNLFIKLRGLRGDFMRPGEKRSVPFLPGSFADRLSHQPPAWIDLQIERQVELQSVEVPAGTFVTVVYVLTTANGRRGVFHIEREYPHRIVRWLWEGGDGAALHESGELTGSARLAYWKLNREGDESYLEQLGLTVP